MPNVNRFATLLFATLLMPLIAARAGRAPRCRWTARCLRRRATSSARRTLSQLPPRGWVSSMPTPLAVVHAERTTPLQKRNQVVQRHGEALLIDLDSGELNRIWNTWSECFWRPAFRFWPL